MEIIIIEKKTFEEMVARFNHFIGRLESICDRYAEKGKEVWMDNQDVCRILSISPRTLQTLRDNGTLAFSKISHKAYYRSEDVRRLVTNLKERKKGNSNDGVSRLNDGVYGL